MRVKVLRKIMVTMVAAFFVLAVPMVGGVNAEEELPVADKSKGVTYWYNDEGKVIGYDLNGNSAIIEASSDHYNITIDKNSNGAIDSGESKVSLPKPVDQGQEGGEASTELDPEIPIYGSVNSTVNDSVRITFTGNTSHDNAVYGTYGSRITGDLIFTINDSETPVSFYGAYSSTVEGNVDIELKKASIKQIFGISTETTVGGDFTFVSDKNCSFVGNSYITNYKCSIDGNADINIKNKYEDYDKENWHSLYGLNYTSVAGDLNIEITGGILRYIYAINNYYYVSDPEYTIGGETNINIHDIDTGFTETITDEVTGYTSINTFYGGIYGINYGNNNGDVTVNLKNIDSGTSSVYGTYANAVNGDNITINIDNVKAGSLYGMNNIRGNVNEANVDITNCEAGNINGIYRAAIDVDSVDVTIDKCSSKSSIYGIYAHDNVYNYSEGKDIPSYLGDSDVSISVSNCSTGAYTYYDGNIDGYSCGSIYLGYGYSDGQRDFCGGDVILNSSDNESYNFYGFCGGKIGGNLTFTSTNDKTISYSYTSVYGYTNNGRGSFYGLNSNTTIKGSATVDVNDAELQYTYLLDASAEKGITANISNCTVKASSFYIYSDWNGYEKKNNATVTLSDVVFQDYYDDEGKLCSTYIANAVRGTGIVDVTIDDTCILPSQYEISANTRESNAECFIRTPDALYIGGKVQITDELIRDYDTIGFSYFNNIIEKSISDKKLSFNFSNTYIPKNVNITSSDVIDARYSSFLIEGTLDGEFYEYSQEEQNSYYGQTIAQNNHFYMNGGTCSTIPEKANVYYPITVSNNNEIMGSVSIENGTYQNSLNEDIVFGKTSNNVGFRVTPKEGFEIKNVTLEFGGANSSTSLSETQYEKYTDYTFKMSSKPAAISVVFVEKKISIGKTVQDPVAVIGKTYTADDPLYDFDSIMVSNDSDVGELIVGISSNAGNALPSGLTLQNRKIVGTYSGDVNIEGTDVKFDITTRNGSKGNVTLNIKTVNKKEDAEGSSIGRVTLDTVNKIVNLYGNSVVIEEVEGEGTCIFMDDDQDGVADSTIPALRGELSQYTLACLVGAKTDKSISVIMKGGVFAGVKGFINSIQTIGEGAEKGLYIDIQGGSVGDIYALETSTTDSEIYIGVAKGIGGNVSGYAGYSNYRSCKGILMVSAGEATTAGTYHMDSDAEFKSLTCADQISSDYNTPYFIISENKEVKIKDELYIDSYAGIFVHGRLTAPGFVSLYGRLIIAKEGSLNSEYEIAGVYYPYTCESNLKNTTMKPNYYLEFKNGDVTDTYIRCGYGIYFSLTQPAGYTVKYKINDGEYFETTSTSFNSTPPICPINVKLEYTPKQIEISKVFTQAKGMLNNEYTKENPLFDYTVMPIKNDTVADYSDMEKPKYEIISGKLPQGLTLEDGKVFGTPTKLEGGIVVVSVTGLNGTKTDISIEYTIESTVTYEDINDKITYDGYDMDLNGTSVVMLPDYEDGSKVNIYMDANHDGVADNSNPYIYNGSSAISLGGCPLYGYTNNEEPLNSDLSIYIYGGSFGNVYGVMGYYGESVIVNGDVTLNISGGNISYNSYAVCNGEAKNATYIATGGSFAYNVSAAYNSKISEDVNFEFSHNAKYYNDGYYANNYLTPTNGSEVGNDVNVTIGFSSTGTVGLTGRYPKYFGVYKTKVGGDVDYNIIGNFSTPYNYSYLRLVSENTVVEGDVNVDWQNGTVTGPNKNTDCTIIYNTEVKGDLNVNVAGCPASSSRLYALADSKVNNLYWNGPDCKSIVTTTMIKDGDSISKILGNGYMLNGNTLEISGNETLDKDFAGANLKVYQNSILTIKENVSVSLSNALTSYGHVINQGSINLASMVIGNNNGKPGKVTNKGIIASPVNYYDYLNIYANGELYNEGTMTFNGEAYIYGTFNNLSTGNATFKARIYTEEDITPTIKNSGILTTDHYFSIFTSFENSGKHVANYNGGLIIQENASYINKDGGILELNNKISNSGYIANYGSIIQNYNNDNNSTFIGKIYNAGELKLGLSETNQYYKNYVSNSSLYYPVTAEYPEDIFGGITLGTENCPVSGDTNAYAKAGADLSVTFDSPADGYTVEDIKKVYIGDEEMSSSGGGTFVGKMPMQPSVVTVEMKVGDGSQITLNPDSTSFSGLQVGKAIEEIDLTKIVISNDADVEGRSVRYTESTRYPLPKGLKVVDGKITGTPAIASETEQTSKIIITGKNYSRAEYTITFGAIEKGVPVFKMPKPFGYSGYLLKNVYMDEYQNQGTYSWDPAEKPEQTVIDEKAINEETFKLFFTPSDIANYDWTKVENEQVSWNSSASRLEIDILVTLYQSLPEYEVPEYVNAVYGQTLADVELPSDDNGKFEWMESGKSVGKVGQTYFLAKYVPFDQKRYRTQNNIAILVVVSKAEKYATLFKTFEAANGDTIGDITLPASEEGKFVWVSEDTMNIYSNRLYRVVFIPDDTTNITWRVSPEDAANDAYVSATYGGIVFNVRAVGDDLEEDPSGGDIEPTPTPTETPTETPSIVPTETPEVSPSKEPTTEPSIVPTTEPTSVPTSEPSTVPTTAPTETPAQPTPTPGAAPGTVLTPSDSKDNFKAVDSSALSADDEDPDEADEVSDDDIEGPFAVYTGPANKNVTSVTVPDTITVGGVTYKVIEISDSAFAGCKKLKKVVIGNNVRVIGKNAFSGCKSLATVTFKATSHVKNIKDNAFKGCVALKKITIPASVKYIRNNVFSGCTKLQTVTFAKKSKLRRIGKKAFFNCKSMKSMKLTSVKLKKVGS
ncbi:MAG: leucine-rich repeat protein, partial [Eubacterium sp.]|nr:leucine-rich repeat protein [Eubacterium sp.]